MNQTPTLLNSENSEVGLDPTPRSTPRAATVRVEADPKKIEANRRKCRKWRLKNVERERQRVKQWHLENKQSERAYRLKNKSRELQNKKAWRKANPHKLREENRVAQSRKNKWLKEWRKKNPEKSSQYYRNSRPAQYRRYAERRKTDPQFVMAERIRGRMGVALARQLAKKFKPTFDLLGCSLFEFVSRMESLFCFGMSWSNRSVWHLDHIVPVRWFNLLDSEEQSVCFNWKNFEPLWGKDNLRKSETLPDPIPSWLPPHIAARITLRSAQPKHPQS